MLEAEGHKMNRKATKKRTTTTPADEGTWLYALLADVHEDVASQPRPQAIRRIRRQLYAAIDTPERAAA